MYVIVETGTIKRGNLYKQAMGKLQAASYWMGK